MYQALSLDLILTVPLCYLFIAWRLKLSKVYTIPIFGAMLLLSTQFIPKEEQVTVDFFIYYVFPLIELVIFFIILSKIRQFKKLFAINKSVETDSYSIIKNTLSPLSIRPRLHKVMSSEFSLLYYAFLSSKAERIKDEDKSFSYQKNAALSSLLILISMLFLIEGIAIHILLANFSIVAAWILTSLTVYSYFFFLGHYRASFRRGIELTDNSLIIRDGLFIPLVTIPFSNIILINDRASKDNENVLSTFSPFGHNLSIELKNEMQTELIYGIQKSFKSLNFNVDRKVTFIQKLRELV